MIYLNFDANTIITIIIVVVVLQILFSFIARFFTSESSEKKKTAIQRIFKNLFNSVDSYENTIETIEFEDEKDYRNFKKLKVLAVIPFPFTSVIVFKFSTIGFRNIAIIDHELISSSYHTKSLRLKCRGLCKQGYFFLPVLRTKERHLQTQIYKNYEDTLKLLTDIEENVDLFDIKSTNILMAAESTRKDKQYLKTLLSRDDKQIEESDTVE